MCIGVSLNLCQLCFELLKVSQRNAVASVELAVNRMCKLLVYR
jgi:hypothetical protein